MIKFIDGSKTYIIVLLFFISLIASQVGYIDAESFNTISLALGFGGAATLRHGIQKLENK